MSTALRVPLPATEPDARRRSDLLVAVVRDLLQATLDDTTLLLLQVDCPVLLDGPVVVERASTGGRTQAAVAMTVVRMAVPPTVHVAGGSVLVAATDPAALAQARLLPLLIATVLEAELRRHLADNALRGALEIANRDPATGLGNRRAWSQALRIEVSRAQRTGRPLAVLVLDLDGLKAVNDEHGHAAGDELISRTAGALASARRATDQVCRLGGDEFGIVAPDTDRAQATALATRVRSIMDARGVRISLGWAVDAQGATADELWQQADAAMYEDKRARRG
jgi:diguanylate cyclase (GGDEF)-like protein